jgi:hypothetical protein
MPVTRLISYVPSASKSISKLHCLRASSALVESLRVQIEGTRRINFVIFDPNHLIQVTHLLGTCKTICGLPGYTLMNIRES